jgi:protein SPT2
MNPGRDRSAYLSRDVVSDDEDMEVDIRALEREEARSRKIAKREEEEAEAEERRHAEEKKRRKKEKEMREKGRA